jgi:hypothetical protein
VDANKCVSEYANGVTGNALIKLVHALEIRPTASSLCNAILLSLHICDDEKVLLPCDAKQYMHMFSEDQYGALLVYLSMDNIIAQKSILYSIQSYCHRLGFPKLSIMKNNQKNDVAMIDMLYRLVYTKMIVTEEAFIEWSEDNACEIHGKSMAVIQTNSFLNWVRIQVEENDCTDESEE